MINKINCIAAIDMTGPFSSWCIADYNYNIIAKESIKISRKSNSVFFDVFRQKVQELGIKLIDIKKWYVGVGPGSYTGIRVAAAFVSGLRFGYDEMEIIGIPSYYPIAAEIMPNENEKVGVIFQLTHKSLLVYKVVKSNGLLITDNSPVIIEGTNVGQMKREYDRLVTIVELDSSLLLKNINLPENIIKLTAFPVERMFAKECGVENCNLEELIYTRPPVTTSS